MHTKQLSEKSKALLQKNMSELQKELEVALLQKFQLRMQLSMGHIQQNHLVSQNRRWIAKIKTLMTQKRNQS